MSDLLAKGRFPTPVDQSAVASMWSDRGYSCNAFLDPPDHAWSDFVHDCNLLIAVCDGCLEITVDGIPLVACPGDEVFVPKGAIHTVRNLHDGTTHWLYGYDEH